MRILRGPHLLNGRADRASDRILDTTSVDSRCCDRFVLVGSVVDSAANLEVKLVGGIRLLLRHPQVQRELPKLLSVLAERIDHRLPVQHSRKRVRRTAGVRTA
jgi:hypothetical protein